MSAHCAPALHLHACARCRSLGISNTSTTTFASRRCSSRGRNRRGTALSTPTCLAPAWASFSSVRMPRALPCEDRLATMPLRRIHRAVRRASSVSFPPSTGSEGGVAAAWGSAGRLGARTLRPRPLPALGEGRKQHRLAHSQYWERQESAVTHRHAFPAREGARGIGPRYETEGIRLLLPLLRWDGRLQQVAGELDMADGPLCGVTIDQDQQDPPLILPSAGCFDLPVRIGV